jgi:uncharacterized protein involved in exopolysaccharide biosynthesis
MIRLFLLRFFETYFRHRWLYLLPVVILMATGAYYLLNLTPKYVARGVLHVTNQSLLTSLTAVQNNDTNWWITPAQATSNEINELMQTDAFVRAVINYTDLEENMNYGADQVAQTLRAVRNSIWVYPMGNNQVYINASYEDPPIAYQLVNAIINSYTQWQINTMRSDSQVAKGFFTSLINEYEAELEAARQALKDYYEAHPQPVRGERPPGEQLELDALQSAVNIAASRYTSALEKQENANLAMTQIESDVRQTYVLLDAPILPDKSDLSMRKLAIQFAAFGAAGIVLSIIAVIGAVLLDRSFRLPVDVENRLSLPVLAVVPELTPRIRWYQRLLPARFKAGREAPQEEVSTQEVETSLTASNIQKVETRLDVRL